MSHADSDDYDEVVDDVLSFKISDIEQCHNISVRDDRNCEYETEHFISHLTTDDYNIAITIAMLNVHIEDRREMECSELLLVKIILRLVNLFSEIKSGSEFITTQGYQQQSICSGFIRGTFEV